MLRLYRYKLSLAAWRTRWRRVQIWWGRTAIFERAVFVAVSLTAVAAFAPTAKAEPLFHLAENKGPVAIVKVVRTLEKTEISLKVLQALKTVCWYSTGPNSPYLLANSRRYRFVSGENTSACPTPQGYAAQEVMVLRFQPLESGIREFSLVEGEGGENQMVDPKSSKETFWNFLHIRSD